jgi:hypothetical protein
MIRRLLADADLNASIVSGVLRRSSHLDFKRAEQVPLESLHDEQVLSIATGDGRVLVSHDVSTMPDHFRNYVRLHSSPGIILVPQELSVGAAIESLLLITEACGDQDLANKICLVPSFVIYGF